MIKAPPTPKGFRDFGPDLAKKRKGVINQIYRSARRDPKVCSLIPPPPGGCNGFTPMDIQKLPVAALNHPASGISLHLSD